MKNPKTRRLPRVAVYLDGLSESIHGNADAQARDTAIRQKVEEKGVTVIVIARSDLDDPEAMRRHYRRLAYAIQKPELLEGEG